MEDSIICPKCHSENPKSNTQCNNCGYIFTKSDKEEDISNSSDHWLDALRETGELRESNFESENDQKEFTNNQEEEDDDSIPEWLRRIRDINTTDQAKEEEGNRLLSEEKTQDLPDLGLPQASSESTDFEWLNDFRNISESENTYQSEEEEVLPSEETSLEDVDESQPLLTIDEIKQDWKNEFPTMSKNPDKEEIAPAEDLPDWLNSDLLSNLESNENMPDWLAPSPSAQSSEEEEKTPTSSKELPDWLNHPDASSLEELNKTNQSDPSIPGWLHEINSPDKDGSSSSIESTTEENVEKVEIEDSELLFNKLEINFEDHSDEEDKESGEIIDSNHDNVGDRQKEHSDTVTPAFIFSEEDLISEKPFLFDDESLQFENENFKMNEAQFGFQRERDEGLDQVDESSHHYNAPFTFENIPDWLEKVDLDTTEFEPESLSTTTDEDDEEEEDQEPKVSEKQPSRDISKANLPEWLKAIRPIEVVTPDISKIKNTKKVEQAGPLAGLRGVLTTENIANTYTTSSSNSLNINVSDKQYAHAKLLEAIVTPKRVEDINKHEKTQSNLLAILIPVVFLSIVIYSLFLEKVPITRFINFPAETVRFHNLITGYLNQNQEPGNILLISEVDSSAYPEINLIASGVLENIFLNNNYLTALSTNPNGVIVADNILNNASLKVPSYNYSEKAINLGYLPGNYLGIQAFLSNPRQFILEDTKQQNIWTTTHLSNTNAISDFDLLLLITDNSDNAKKWVEQIELISPESGLLVISTTQASPLLQPYLNSNQIDGMISGIAGSLAFNQLSNTESTELNDYWSINQMAVLIVILLMLVGSIVSIFSKLKPLVSQKKKQ